MANHVESQLMVVQRLVLAIIHNHRNYIVHDEVVRVIEGKRMFRSHLLGKFYDAVDLKN